jgi:hypothetical protein
MDDIVQRPEKEQEDLVIALGAIKFIKSLHKEVMLIHNPVYWYLIGHIREPALEALSAAVSREGLEVTRMEKYLPPDKSERDWVTWYNLPHDGKGCSPQRPVLPARSAQHQVQSTAPLIEILPRSRTMQPWPSCATCGLPIWG